MTIKEEGEEMQECKGEVFCKVSAKRMWRASCEDCHNCLPKALPDAIMSIEYEGQVFQPGSIRTLYYAKSYAQRVSKENCLKHLVEYTKEKILEIDDDLLKLKLEAVSGGFLGIIATYYNYTLQFVEGSLPDTCVAHWSYRFKPISPKHYPLMYTRLQEILPASFKGLEAYLLANDDYED